MIVIDSHLDIALNAFYLDRDPRKSIAGIREDEAEVAGTGLDGAGIDCAREAEGR